MRTFAEIFRANCDFDENGKHRNGTDRASNHNYSEAYGRLFPNSRRNEIQLILEVGNADGSGLLSFVEAFPNAYIVGLDIHPVANRHKRVETNLGDATRRVDCEMAIRGRKFDLIIDDATHKLGDILTTLLFLWSSVKVGGVYIIEEMEDIHSLHRNLVELLPNATIVNTNGPFGGIEPLVVIMK